MAYLNDTHNGDAGLLGRVSSSLSHWISNIVDTLMQYRKAHRTYVELSNLSDRELADLNISRYDLRRIAREAAQGKL